MNIKNKILEIMGEDIAFSIDGALQESYKDKLSVNPASVIKLSVLYGALNRVDQGLLSLDRLVQYKTSDLVPGSGSLKDLSIRMMSVLDLLMLMITVSDNTATNILMDHIGINHIQASIEALGLQNTFVRRKLYHMIPGVFNASCTSDTNLLLQAFDSGTLSSESKSIAMDILSRQQFTNFTAGISVCSKCGEIFTGNYCRCKTFVGDVDPEPIRIYSKSGEISGHVHDAAIIKYNNQTVYLTLFTYNQINNKETKDKFALIGQILLEHLKELPC